MDGSLFNSGGQWNETMYQNVAQRPHLFPMAGRLYSQPSGSRPIRPTAMVVGQQQHSMNLLEGQIAQRSTGKTPIIGQTSTS